MATIQGVYIALFGRPADPAGLAFFNTATSNGANLTAIGDLAATDEYQDRFDGMNNTAIITTIYQSLFGRDPDTAGLTFFVAALQAGTLNINNIAIAILDGAQGDDATIIANKLVAANAFTAEINTPLEIDAYKGADAITSGIAFLAPITSDTATIPTAAATTDAVKAIEVAGVAGETVTIPDAAYVSTSNNDVLTVAAYTAAGVINGGFGTDSLNVTLAAAGPVVATDKLVSIEKLFVTADDATVAVITAGLDVTDVAGLSEVWNKASIDNLSVTGLDVATAVGVSGTVAGTTTFAFADVAGTADTAKLVLDTAVAGTVTVAGIETLNVVTSGVTSVSGLVAAAAETVTVTGTGQLTLGGTFAADATVDASGHTGKFIFTSAVAADGLTVIGGAANDTFNITAGAHGVTLTGGAGSDLFNISAITNIDAVTNVGVTAEVISITDFDGTADTLRLDLTGAEATFTNTQLSDLTGAATLADALVVAASVTGASNYAIFTYGSDTYIYQNDADAAFDSGDGLVKLVGFTGDLTTANFVHV